MTSSIRMKASGGRSGTTQKRRRGPIEANLFCYFLKNNSKEEIRFFFRGWYSLIKNRYSKDTPNTRQMFHKKISFFFNTIFFFFLVFPFLKPRHANENSLTGYKFCSGEAAAWPKTPNENCPCAHKTWWGRKRKMLERNQMMGRKDWEMRVDSCFFLL